MATLADRAACLLFPAESGCLARAAEVERARRAAVAAEPGAVPADDGIIASIGRAGSDILDSSAEPLAHVAESAQWTAIAIIALCTTVLVFVGIAVYFYVRRGA